MIGMLNLQGLKEPLTPELARRRIEPVQEMRFSYPGTCIIVKPFADPCDRRVFCKGVALMNNTVVFIRGKAFGEAVSLYPVSLWRLDSNSKNVLKRRLYEALKEMLPTLLGVNPSQLEFITPGRVRCRKNKPSNVGIRVGIQGPQGCRAFLEDVNVADAKLKRGIRLYRRCCNCVNRDDCPQCVVFAANRRKKKKEEVATC